ncbi:hypothetical protein [Schleiferia thermophila]|jgi:hypothetical protein|uniref:hypothetical protein n=2 Tax=Schleiferia thermophila TaxID=884107 RepID=UPI000CB33E30|nr:hypothetical protein CEN47_11290 [Fischerella thermalis CCMEE 5319]
MRIKKQLILLLVVFATNSCKDYNKKYDFTPSKHLTEQEDSAFRYSIIRYVGKLPPKASHTIKFDPYFDEYYVQLANTHKLDYYYTSEDGLVYFQVSRIAPSLHEKYVATGGKMKVDDRGNIIYYEEVYRTWKMPLNDMLKVTKNVFTDMVNGKSLEKYYTSNTSEDVYIIEFPDEDTYFDTEKRVWISKRADVLQQFEEEKLRQYEKNFLQRKEAAADSLK